MKSSWLAPAKLNLFLHITGQREDGYHTLQTVFQFLDYSDELYFSRRDDGIINLEPSIEGVADKDNLIVRAAHKLQSISDKDSSKLGINISIKKKLPMGGGLGGGSSDAATTLIALNDIWQLNLSDEQLKKVGLELGADVPVFIHGKACLAQGIGEQFEDVTPVESWYLILVPNCQVNTGEIFSDQALTRNSKTLRIRALLDWEIMGGFRNDCEAVVRKNYPEINQALNWLSTYGLARMTGTGCCVFSAFTSEKEAKDVEKLVPKGLNSFVAKGVNNSPIRRFITQTINSQ